jgi:hypothetical protein
VLLNPATTLDAKTARTKPTGAAFAVGALAVLAPVRRLRLLYPGINQATDALASAFVDGRRNEATVVPALSIEQVSAILTVSGAGVAQPRREL